VDKAGISGIMRSRCGDVLKCMCMSCGLPCGHSCRWKDSVEMRQKILTMVCSDARLKHGEVVLGGECGE
jgi:hypothetical protein